MIMNQRKQHRLKHHMGVKAAPASKYHGRGNNRPTAKKKKSAYTSRQLSPLDVL
uniref:Uncharacterized protein n=1 Tax=Arundo donax TaxID=35708 RepID=A0A0A8XZC6_ARUDO